MNMFCSKEAGQVEGRCTSKFSEIHWFSFGLLVDPLSRQHCCLSYHCYWGRYSGCEGLPWPAGWSLSGGRRWSILGFIQTVKRKVGGGGGSLANYGGCSGFFYYVLLPDNVVGKISVQVYIQFSVEPFLYH